MIRTTTRRRCMSCLQIGRCLDSCPDWATTVIVHPIDPPTRVMEAPERAIEARNPDPVWAWVAVVVGGLLMALSGFGLAMRQEVWSWILNFGGV